MCSSRQLGNAAPTTVWRRAPSIHSSPFLLPTCPLSTAFYIQRAADTQPAPQLHACKFSSISQGLQVQATSAPCGAGDRRVTALATAPHLHGGPVRANCPPTDHSDSSCVCNAQAGTWHAIVTQFRHLLPPWCTTPVHMDMAVITLLGFALFDRIVIIHCHILRTVQQRARLPPPAPALALVLALGGGCPFPTPSPNPPVHSALQAPSSGLMQ